MSNTLGLLGGGQLGRMFCSVARRMGYEVIVVDPDPDAPAKHFASEHICLPNSIGYISQTVCCSDH